MFNRVVHVSSRFLLGGEKWPPIQILGVTVILLYSRPDKSVLPLLQLYRLDFTALSLNKL